MNDKYILYHKSGKTIMIPKSDVYWGSNIEWSAQDEKYNNNNIDEMPINIFCWVKSYEFNIGGYGWKRIK